MFSDVRDALPQTLANLAIVIDMLKRYNKGVEQTFVIFPQDAAIAQANVIFENEALVHFGISLNHPAAVPDRVRAGRGVAVARRHQHRAAAVEHLLQDPKGLPGQRGSRCTQLSLRGRAG